MSKGRIAQYLMRERATVLPVWVTQPARVTIISYRLICNIYRDIFIYYIENMWFNSFFL